MKTYTINGKTFDHLPDPVYLDGAAHSPMTDERFVALGGEIHDDGEPTPEERVCESFRDLIADLAEKTDKIMPVLHMAAA